MGNELQNLLVYDLDSPDQIIEYKLLILTGIRPAWLLPVALGYSDNSARLVIDVSGYTSLASYIEQHQPDMNEKQVIFEDIVRNLELADEWLLPANQFLLDPKTIYLNKPSSDTLDLYLACWPVGAEEQDSSLPSLAKLAGELGIQHGKDQERIDLNAPPAPERVDSKSTSNLRSSLAVLGKDLWQKAIRLADLLLIRLGEQVCRGTQDPKDHEDRLTAVLTDDPESFRMAMLSEGKPGTPDESNGVRAYILIDDFLVGRDIKHCDLCLPSPNVGRQHAKILRRAGSFFICDLGSPNGTRVDDKRLTKDMDCLLPDQCTIRFADQAFYFRAD